MRALHPLGLGALDVHGHAAAVEREQLAQALDRVAHDVAAAVVGVVVGDERAGEAQAVGGEQVDAARRRRTRGRSTTASPVSRSPTRYTKFTIWRASGSSRAKSAPDRSWRKYERSSLSFQLTTAACRIDPIAATNAPGSFALADDDRRAADRRRGSSGGAYHSKPSPSMASTTDCGGVGGGHERTLVRRRARCRAGPRSRCRSARAAPASPRRRCRGGRRPSPRSTRTARTCSRSTRPRWRSGRAHRGSTR